MNENNEELYVLVPQDLKDHMRKEKTQGVVIGSLLTLAAIYTTPYIHRWYRRFRSELQKEGSISEEK